MVSSLKVATETTLKWRRNLGLTGFRPPPGGPMAQMNWMSIKLTFDVSFLSYQFPWSKYWRSNSIGGWAPYFSRAGILTSSTKMTNLQRRKTIKFSQVFSIPIVNLDSKSFRESACFLSNLFQTNDFTTPLPFPGKHIENQIKTLG